MISNTHIKTSNNRVVLKAIYDNHKTEEQVVETNLAIKLLTSV